MQKTIFIVDDSKMNLIIIKEALKDLYRVMTIQSAEKMFSLMEKLTPDLILLDILMPETDGFEALRLLRNNPAYANISVILLSGTIDDSIKEKGLELGVVDFILKPFEKENLLSMIGKYI